ncbi:MAG: nickel pincer cofactor biosynthesis protein LarC [Armatimonadaceae bacterium]
MTLGALLACGADETAFRNALAGLQVPGYRLHVSRRKVEGLMSTDVEVELLEEEQGHGRHLSDIAAIYEQSDLSPGVRENALAIFTRLAEAEAKVHGTTPDKIHFHEVGAVDAIVDITGVCILLELLGVEEVYSSPLPMSRGFVYCQHGMMPLPAPATMELFVWLPTYPVSVSGELVTPTGAAIVAALAGPKRSGECPPMVPQATGYGAGKKDWGAPFPNLLRVIIGEVYSPSRSRTPQTEEKNADTVVVLETNVDDASPEVLGYAQEQLLAQGALDVFFVAAQMKKNRPGTLITVLAAPDSEETLTQTLLRETGSFGIRRSVRQRTVLERRFDTVDTPYGSVRVKVGSLDSGIRTVAPEYEDCRRVAADRKIPLRDVYRAAMQASAPMAAG